jgi:hypothetical protein
MLEVRADDDGFVVFDTEAGALLSVLVPSI